MLQSLPHRGCLAAILVVTTVIATAACGHNLGDNAASSVLKNPELPTDTQAKCKVKKSQSEPLVVEWPEMQRAKLESLRRRGLVAVHYEGCELSMLSQCWVRGAYRYAGITRKESRVTIRSEDELYARMPAFAVQLEGKLKSAGQLNVQMTLVGRYETQVQLFTTADLEGDCAGATHVVSALTVGAYTFSSGADAEVGGQAKVLGAGGGAKSTAARDVLQRDGDEASCAQSQAADKSPPEGCSATLQLEVMPIAAKKVGEKCASTATYACTSDHKEMLVCSQTKAWEKWRRCRGPGGCSERADYVGCDATIAEVDDTCGVPNATACSEDRTKQLVCRGGKFVLDHACSSGCAISGTSPETKRGACN